MNLEGQQNDERLVSFITGKKVLVTGGTGSIGRIIVEKLLNYSPQIVRIYSRDPVKQIQMQNELNDPRLRFILGDVRDQERLLSACEDINAIFHAAAFKYVPQGEYNPFETIQSNVIGTQHIITASLKTPSVKNIVMISTDKAVAPTSTMGASKLLAERLITSAHYIQGKREKIFTTVRFGNVIGTVGSVVPIFQKHAKENKSITITHPDMTRFFMTIPDAVGLVFKAMTNAIGGEVFVLKMPALRIMDLAKVCAQRYSSPPVKINIGEIRPGEKIHETLLTEDEARVALETSKVFIIPPQVSFVDVSPLQYTYSNAKKLESNDYKTETASILTKKEISALLDRAGL